MPEYIIEMSMGGSMRVKIDAPSEDKALEMAAVYFIEDWENAGLLKISDIHIDSARPIGDFVNPMEGVDASIKVSGPDDWSEGGDWEYAEDDPQGRGEE